MAENTGIEWCDHTFNSWRGCTKVSAGCENCYAERGAKRNPAVLGEWGPRDQCASAGVAFFFKQWGGTNKKKAGALLDGREHREWPAALRAGEETEVAS